MKTAIWTGLYAELPLHEALKMLHHQGWTSFEISTEHLVRCDADGASTVDDALRAAQDLDLEIPQAHAYLQADVACEDKQKREEDVATLDRHLLLCSALGVKVVVIHPGGRITDPSEADRRAIQGLNIEAFRRLGDRAGSLHLQIGIENLMHPGASHPAELMDLIDSINHETVGITLDTSHANVVKLDIPAAIREFGPRLIATHISDNDGSGDQHRTPGFGTVDWPPVAAALREIGYTGLFNLEIPGERHSIPELRTLKSRHALEVAKWLVTS